MNKDKILNAVKGKAILVVGDIILDTFMYGDVDRISPEGPVPVLSITRQDTMLGGVGNVISNLFALGCAPIPFCVVGDDDAAHQIRGIIKDMGLKDDGVVSDSSRPTTLKTRFVARSQQLLRSDIEKTHPITSDIEKIILDKLSKSMNNISAIVISDYGKGVLTPALLSSIIQMARGKNIPVLIDPKGADYSIYRGANIITPNRKELSAASGLKTIKSDDDIERAALGIIKDCGIDCVVATRSEDGLSIVQSDAPAIHIPTNARQVFDVSGAGDTVIATLAAMISAGADINEAAHMANIAGGIAVSKIGTTPVSFHELSQAVLEDHAHGGHQAIVTGSFDDAAKIVKQWQDAGQKVGLTNGCFDIVHAGHVQYINQARAKCDRLVLALNHDNSVKILKGPMRPVNDEQARATVIGGLGAVDMVVFFGANKAGDDNTPCALVDSLRPNIFFKGGDYTIDQLPEGKVVQSYGGEVEIMAMHDGFSTTAIIARSVK